MTIDPVTADPLPGHGALLPPPRPEACAGRRPATPAPAPTTTAPATAPAPTTTATGPHDAAFLPRLRFARREPERPITAPVPKLGGEPCWLADPVWPVSPATGEPLLFVGQFAVPGAELRLAYLFLEEGEITGGIDPEAGDALLLVQPGGRIPSFAVIGPPGTRGRTLRRRGPDGPDGAGTPVEFHLDLLPVPADVDRSMDDRAAFQRYLRGEGPEVPFPDGGHVYDHVGGLPSFPSGVAGVPAPWRFFFALQDAPDEGDPYFLDFGYGVGAAFLSPDGLEGRFCWDIP
ncbi:hypothetical protein ACFQ6N_10875 [Kitasatospora sp. NPDC056446]|uniref:hypothetical protein n=1 Tax=Kitasatospora sp. NPDC056446 TaxID=3345819 RepID=UPI003692DEE2